MAETAVVFGNNIKQQPVVRVRADVDHRFRTALLNAAREAGGKRAHRLICRALLVGPDRDGIAACMRRFGSAEHLQAALAGTESIIDGLEVTCPGFKRWLDLTGFGNDPTMVEGFAAWVERTDGPEKMLAGMRRTFGADR